MELDYVGVCRHGRLIAVMVGDAKDRRALAKHVADVVRRGLDLVRLATEDVRKMPWGCDECFPAKRKAKCKAKEKTLFEPATTEQKG